MSNGKCGIYAGIFRPVCLNQTSLFGLGYQWGIRFFFIIIYCCKIYRYASYFCVITVFALIIFIYFPTRFTCPGLQTSGLSRTFLSQSIILTNMQRPINYSRLSAKWYSVFELFYSWEYRIYIYKSLVGDIQSPPLLYNEANVMHTLKRLCTIREICVLHKYFTETK